MKIRLLQPEDKPEWLRLRAALWPDDTRAEHEQEMADILAHFERMPVFVAEVDGSLCGLLEVSIRDQAEGCQTDHIGYLEGWFVDEAFRQQGVGRQLVIAAEAWAKAQGCTEMASDTTLDYPLSPAAHAKLGYEEVARTIHFHKWLNT